MLYVRVANAISWSLYLGNDTVLTVQEAGWATGCEKFRLQRDFFPRTVRLLASGYTDYDIRYTIQINK